MRKFFKGERGDVNIGGLMLMGIAMIFIAVGFIIFPVIMEGTDGILDWTYSDNASFTIDEFTGLEPVAGVTPLICLLGFVSAAVLSGVAGFRSLKGSGGSGGPKNVMMLGIGQIFIAVMLIIFPVILEGLASVIDPGIDSAYTGLAPIMRVVPLIVLTGGIIMTVVSQFFAGRKMLG